MSQHLPSPLSARLLSKQAMLWLNDNAGSAPVPPQPAPSDIESARARLQRCRGLLAKLFPQLAGNGGAIESPLLPLASLQQAQGSDAAREGMWLLKADHALPVAGSIKARGGFHEVLALAESIAQRHGLLDEAGDRAALASPAARECFSHHAVMVGSTGNLGMSIGLIAAALGFRAVVHMSVDAKAWKKERLRRHGVQVVEHAGDYAQAVAAGRSAALADPTTHFVDDEHSLELFLGYATAARELADQLQQAGRMVDAAHPLFVYLPCGVGGAPGGIALGLKTLFGEHVHCFFAEPAAAPCMLVQLAAGLGAPVSVYDIGLDNRTEADGLAVGLASPLVSPLMASLLSGVFTVEDRQLFAALLSLFEAEGIELEPSAAAGLPGPAWICRSETGRAYLDRHGLGHLLANATHVVWSTGGSLVPAAEHVRFRAEGRRLRGDAQPE
ncbi:D-serine ammonia-lyase [Chromobacterium sphagni]|uniref:Probable D-serine dehydratase n=1 Tax=Chromobacterium sphagni TaxID=1903179 RepID=A0A1S1X0U5_9NEIS|nr:D-serine ammonia-lyase [Chromobacterium sphagni]OHX13142.1 D-serine ammonia-lyase [Chromobacterium sphagni]